MSNIIQTKRGSDVPNGKLAPYELGINTSDNQLYFGGAILDDGSYGNAQGIKVAIAAGAMTLVNTDGEPYNAGANNIPVFLENGVIKSCTFGEVSVGLIAESAQRWTNKQRFSVTLNKEGGQTADVDGSAEVNLGVTGVLPITKGGTGATDAEVARNNLGLGAVSVENVLPIKKGGTGATDAAGVLTSLGITASTTELNCCDGVTSNIQTQLNEKTYAETKTVSISGNSTSTLTFSGKVQCVYVTIGNGTSGNVVSGFWNSDCSKRTNAMYGYVGSSLESWTTTVEISEKTVKITRGGSTTLNHYVTAICTPA